MELWEQSIRDVGTYPLLALLLCRQLKTHPLGSLLSSPVRRVSGTSIIRKVAKKQRYERLIRSRFAETRDSDALLSLQYSQQRLINGEMSFIDKRYIRRSFEEGKLVEIIKRCWQTDPDNRPSIFEIMALLRKAIDEREKRNAKEQ